MRTGILAVLAALSIIPWSLGARERDRSQAVDVGVWSPAAVSGQGDLVPEEFEVRIDGVEATLERKLDNSSDLLTLLVLDLTESISNADTAKEALRGVIHGMAPQTYIGVLRAQDGLSVLLDPTSDPDALVEAILAVPVSGRAGLLNTVELACQLAQSILEKAMVRVAILYVTDSDIRNYREDYVNPVINRSDSRDISREFPEELVKERISRLRTRLDEYSVPLFVVHLDYSSDRLNEAYQTGLLQIAEDSGGGAVFCRSRVEIAEAIGRTFAQVASHHRIRVRLPEPAPKTVSVQVSNGGRPLRYRSRFVLAGR